MDTSTLQLWRKLFSLSDGSNWVKIPPDLCHALRIDSRLGILGNMLCTQNSAIGIMQFITRLNRITDSK